MPHIKYRPEETSKTLANKLADLLNSDIKDFEQIKNLLEQLPSNFNFSEKINLKETPNKKTTEGEVGIWKKNIKNGSIVFNRNVQFQHEWPFWANLHTIHPKSSKKRIVLLGESVARGYFYDPYYTVANELEGILNQVKEMGEVEVIDLARVSMHMHGLIELITSCKTLEPDLVVIFAGNNWAPNPENLTDVEADLLELYNKNDLIGIKNIIENNLTLKVESLLKVIEHSLTKNNIPTIFVIPEFNLKDWRSNVYEQDWIMQSKDQSNIDKWMELKHQTDSAILNENITIWQESARDMIKMDSINPLGHEILGDLFLKLKDWGKARTCFERSRDTALFRGCNVQPRCYKFVRSKIVKEAPRYGIGVVDLPSIYKEVLKDSIPDRKLFFDYCHPTVEGIKISMRYTAQKVIHNLLGIEINIEKIVPSLNMPDNGVQAIAHFAAAIHNAHYGQSTEVIAYHCKRALSFSIKVSHVMEKFSDFSTRHASTLFCNKFEDVILNGEMKQYEGGMALVHPREEKLLDITLVDTLTNELKFIKPDLSDRVFQLRCQEHGVTRTTDLLESFYSSKDYNKFLLSKKSNYFTARCLESSFHFIAKPNTKTLKFRLTYRNKSEIVLDKKVKILINHSHENTIELPMTKSWKTVSFTLTSELFREGVNVLAISWPYTCTYTDRAGITGLNSLIDSIFPIFGQIYSFNVSVDNSF